MSFSGTSWLERHELLQMLVVRNVKIRYKNSVLGFFWSLLTPICFIAIYAIFAGILGIRTSMIGGEPFDFMPYLITGIIVWQYTATCFNDALHAITGNSNLIKKARFPRLLLPLAMVLANAFNFLLTLLVLLAYLAFTRSAFGPVGWLPLALLAQTALCLGLALLIATSNVFFRDTEHIIGVASMAWFFLTPVFYPASRQIEFLAAYDLAPWLVYLNPMTGILGAYRAFFLGLAPAAGGFAISAAVSVCVLVAGLALFQSSEGNFGDVL